MTRAPKPIPLYRQIWRTYWGGAPGLLLLAAAVFVPLGLFDALASEVDLDSLDVTNGLQIAALVAAIAAVTTTGLLGEVFFSGTVAIAVTHPKDERSPPLSEIARRLSYGRLIAVDLVYVTIVVVGLVLFVVPGVLAFVWLGLAGPIVEIEDRTVREALARSWRLVRGSFWTVFGVLVPIEIAGDVIGEGIDSLVHGALGDTLLTSWLAESLSNMAFSPLFAVAAVLLTLELIAAKDRPGPRLNSAAAPP